LLPAAQVEPTVINSSKLDDGLTLKQASSLHQDPLSYFLVSHFRKRQVASRIVN